MPRLTCRWRAKLAIMGLFGVVGMGTACRPAPPVEPLPALSPTGTSAAVVSTPPPSPETAVAAEEISAEAPDIFQPYPYTTPLPPPTPTILDGVYLRRVKFEGTPTPCRRCAPYRAEGGTWQLHFKAGVFHVSHDVTGFSGVGSFTVTGDRLTLFNDPNCHLDSGTYTWEMDGRSLRLTEVADSCAWELRAKNLAAGSWLLERDQTGNRIDPCQPPSTEAAITDHWPAPPGC